MLNTYGQTISFVYFALYKTKKEKIVLSEVLYVCKVLGSSDYPHPTTHAHHTSCYQTRDNTNQKSFILG